MSFNVRRCGLIQLPILIGILIISVAIPALTVLVQENQDVRNRAANGDKIICERCSKNSSCEWVVYEVDASVGCDVLYESQMTIISRTAKCECGKVANATDSKCGTVSTGGCTGTKCNAAGDTCCINSFNGGTIPYCEAGFVCDMNSSSSLFGKCIKPWSSTQQCNRCSSNRNCYRAYFEAPYPGDCSTIAPVSTSLIKYVYEAGCCAGGGDTTPPTQKWYYCDGTQSTCKVDTNTYADSASCSAAHGGRTCYYYDEEAGCNSLCAAADYKYYCDTTCKKTTEKFAGADCSAVLGKACYSTSNCNGVCPTSGTSCSGSEGTVPSGSWGCQSLSTRAYCLNGVWSSSNSEYCQYDCKDGRCNSAPPTTCNDYQGNPISAGSWGCKTATTRAWCNSGVWINDDNCATNGGTCLNGTCNIPVACSKVGDTCCLGGSTGKFCNNSLLCGRDSKCTTDCGGTNENCCYNDKCDTGLTCNSSGKCVTVSTCNSVGDTCCMSSGVAYCNNSLKCGVHGTCLTSCGTKDQVCCHESIVGGVCVSGLSCLNGICKGATETVCGNRPDGTARVVGESWCTGNTLYECINPTGTLINLRTTLCTDGCAALTSTTAKCNVVKKYWQHDATANGYNCSTDSRWMCTETTTVTKFADKASCENDVGCDVTFYRYTCNPVTGNWSCVNTPQTGQPSYSEVTYGSAAAAEQKCITDDPSDLCKKTSTCSVCSEEKNGYVGPDKSGGDYNCDGVLTTGDYIVWRGEYLDYVLKRINKNRYVANGNCKNNPDLYYLTGTRDYSLWRENYLK